MIVTINNGSFMPKAKVNLSLKHMTIAQRINLALTHKGYYKRTPKGAHLLDLNGNVFAYIGCKEQPIIVSARRSDDGKVKHLDSLHYSDAITYFGYGQKEQNGMLSDEDKSRLQQQIEQVVATLGSIC